MLPRPRPIRAELLAHGWWLVPLVLCLWFRQLQLPTPEPGPDADSSWSAVKGWELLTIVRLGIDSISLGGRLGGFHDTPQLTQLIGWKLWGFELAFKLALCALCGWAVLRTQGRLARAVFALALLALPAQLDALACAALLALFRQLLGSPEPSSARAELALLFLGALLAQVHFAYFLLFAAGLALACAALWADVSLRRASAFLLRGAGSFLFLWILFGQSPAAIPAWLQSSCQAALAADESRAQWPTGQLALSLALLAALLLVLFVERGRGARPRALQALVLAAALLAWRWDAPLFFAVVPAAAWFVLAPRPGLPLLLRVVLLGAGCSTLAARPPPRADAQPAEWDLPRVCARAGVETLDVFQDSQAIAFLNGLNYHPRPVFQSRAARTPELLEQNRAFFEGERAALFALCRIETRDGRFAPALDAKAFDELLLRYRPCLEERGWLLLERESEAPRAQASTALLAQSSALGEWLEIAGQPGDALELRLDPRPSARGRLAALFLRAAELECEIERADGSRARATLAPGAARAGFLVRPCVETQAELAQVFLGQPVAGLQRLRLVAAAGEEALWEPELRVELLRRDGLLPPPRPAAALAFEFPDFEPVPSEVAGAEPVRAAVVSGRSVHVFSAPAALRWELQAGSYRLTGSYGMLDAAWKELPASDGALVFVVLQQGREQTQLFRRLLEPASAAEDRGPQPLDLEFELQTPAELYLRMRTGWHDNAVRDWVFWDSVRIQTR